MKLSLTDFQEQIRSEDITAKISPSSLIQKTSMANPEGTKKFEDDTTTIITSMTANQSEDAAKKIFQRAIKEIRPERQSAFTSSSSLHSTLVRLENEPTTVHVLVKNVTEDQIDKALSQVPFRRMTRVWMEIDDAMITITPGGAKHEVTCSTFSSQIMSAIAMIPGHDIYSVVGVGAARFYCPGKRCKEGDSGMRCSTRFGRGMEWPNLMIEVGYSEPLSQLRINAEWWLVNSGGLTRMVIIILISDSPDALDIEVWELGPNPKRQTRLQIDNAAVVSPANASLTIPYAVLFDNAHPSAADIVLSHVQLSVVANHIFHQT